MTSEPESILRLRRLIASVNDLDRLRAQRLRDIIAWFNAEPVTPATIDHLREVILSVADSLARAIVMPDIDMDAAKDAELGARIGLHWVRKNDEQRMVDEGKLLDANEAHREAKG